MAAKTSTLRWDAPADGGSAITGYRVLAYEDGVVVSEVEVETTSTTITHSETVERLALIQAVNDQGYSAPTYLALPAASTAPTGGGGGGGSTPGTPVTPIITVTRTDATHETIAFSSPGDGAWSLVRVLLNGFTLTGATAPGSIEVPEGEHTIQLKLLYGSDYNYVTPLSNLVTVSAYVAPPAEDDNTPLGMSITRAGDSLTFDLTGPATSSQRNLYAYDGGSYFRLDGDFALPTSFTLTNAYTAAASSTALFRFEARSAAGANLGVNTDNPRTP